MSRTRISSFLPFRLTKKPGSTPFSMVMEATRHRSTGSAFRWAITGSAEHLMNHLKNQVKDLGLEFVCHADENLGVETNAGYVQGTTDKGVRRLRQGDA